MPHPKPHLSHRSGWLRAGVLGANDGIISTASLLIGVASANASPQTILLTGIVAIVSGAFSMAAGEYVSVSSQKDLEQADLNMERESIKLNYDEEQLELKQIYQERGLSPDLAQQVARQLMSHDPLAAHARDDIGISLDNQAKPLQAAIASALAFVIGGVFPLLASLTHIIPVTQAIAFTSVLLLVLLGSVSAKLGNASMFNASIRVSFWGILAMSCSALIGHVFGLYM